MVFNWFACLEPGFFRWPHAELIAGYDELDDFDFSYAEGAVDELFDKTETDALVAYLEREHGGGGDETTIKEVNLPSPGNCWGYGARAVGRSEGFYMLAEEPEYSLPFQVWVITILRAVSPSTNRSRAAPVRQHLRCRRQDDH